ncbi:MAG: indole-3-glycerol phosphate synthase TrpC [Planctomycetes bacterium]|nr:indole-3-glycerol phosphate synthase TrpC [Planctomycetota bacterium]
MILDRIVAHKRAVELPRLPAVDRVALRDLPACRGFRAALKRPKGQTARVIAECKKGSPSKGIFAPDYDPVLIAYNYLLGGASCLSVLTDEKFFFGSLDDLIRVRAAVALPIIRKDFIVDERQIAEARLAGADAILLIVACLEDGRLRDLQGFARDLGLDVLVEVHDADEAARALQAAADPIGVNNRDLRDFSITLDTTFDLVPALVDGTRVVVSESGITQRAHCLALEQAGIDAVLVGEALMTSRDPESALKQLRGALS